jgi:hypothetical protein
MHTKVNRTNIPLPLLEQQTGDGQILLGGSHQV